MLSLGDYVKVTNTNLVGYITKITENNYCININDKMVVVNSNRVEKTNKVNEFEKNKKSHKYNITMNHKSDLNDTIMIRHQTVEEALFNLDKFIDNAICNNISQIKIIHGKNGGVLRREVHKYLDKHPSIKEHRLGGYYEGSYGVTIAFLK
ncbi:MAG: Smr/MutS family protein [Clostridia bacterium]|nr:Smr/MutS family protein [Clostridia bacterium]